MVNLTKLEELLDEALEKETPESMVQFMRDNPIAKLSPDCTFHLGCEDCQNMYGQCVAIHGKNVCEDCGKGFDPRDIPDITPYAMCYGCWEDLCEGVT